MCSSISSSDELISDLTMPESTSVAKIVNETTLPEKTANKYIATYDCFIEWKNNKQQDSFSEEVFLTYFKEIAEKYKPSSLWPIYSMLKSTVNARNGINIRNYANLTNYLKRQTDGYVCTKAKVLTREHVEKFIDDAPDYKYLAMKVAFIFGITGACKPQELADISVEDIENHNEMMLVKIPKKVPRSFTIRGKFYKIVKKYESLRRKNVFSKRFFQHYRNGKCTAQHMGVNKFGSMPKDIAKYLNLPDANIYTAHSFRKISGAIQNVNGGWKTCMAAEGYILEDLHANTQQAELTRNGNKDPEITNDVNEDHNNSGAQLLINDFNTSVKTEAIALEDLHANTQQAEFTMNGNKDLEITNDINEDQANSGAQLLINDFKTSVKTEAIDIDLPSDGQDFDSDGMRSFTGDTSAFTSEVKAEFVERSCINDTESCPAHTRLLETILSCVSRQERSAERAARAQEAQAHALERIARILETKQRL